MTKDDRSIVTASDSGGAGLGRPGTDWIESAACRQMDPELFFPVGDSTADARAQLDLAKRVCASCPVRVACLRWAFATGADGGVFGGCSEGERRSIRRRARTQARAAKLTRANAA
jgi:WhiB family redox-sensing transcriptional regulator